MMRFIIKIHTEKIAINCSEGGIYIESFIIVEPKWSKALLLKSLGGRVV